MDAIDDPQMQSEMAAIRQGQELVQAASDKDITRLRELLDPMTLTRGGLPGA